MKYQLLHDYIHVNTYFEEVKLRLDAKFWSNPVAQQQPKFNRSASK